MRLRDSALPWPEGAALVEAEAKEQEGEGEAGGEVKEMDTTQLTRKEGMAPVAGLPAATATASTVVQEQGQGQQSKAEGGVAATDVQVGGGLGPVKFSARLKNEYQGFSNFAAAPFRMSAAQIPGVDGTRYPDIGVSAGGVIDVVKQTWPTVEHYYQAMKFPTDAEWQEAIRRAPTPLRAKKMGLDPNHAPRGDWDSIKEIVMKSALLAKFRMNPALLARLQETGSRALEEVTPGDSYWGKGTRGKGLNRLGRLLEEVRAELKDVRLDLSVLGGVQAGGAVGHVEEAEGEAMEMLPPEREDMEAEARQIVAEATGGAIALPPGSGGEQGMGQPGPMMGGGGGGSSTGGVFMIINPQIGGDLRARRARSRGGNAPISWAGMEPASGQEGGGDSSGSVEAGGAELEGAEIKVEKLG